MNLQYIIASFRHSRYQQQLSPISTSRVDDPSTRLVETRAR